MKPTIASLTSEVNKLKEQNNKQYEQLQRQSELLIEAEKNKKEPEKEFVITITGKSVNNLVTDMKGISNHDTLYALKSSAIALERRINNI